jgi:hypothetical protein
VSSGRYRERVADLVIPAVSRAASRTARQAFDADGAARDLALAGQLAELGGAVVPAAHRRAA